MAVQHSPALPPMRPGLIDPSRQAEYPILLGKTFPGNGTAAGNQLLNVRYNWKSKQIPQRQVITENRLSPGSYRLVVREDTSEPYKYSGGTDPNTTSLESTTLALVFNKEKSAFMLESISNCLNFNLTYATTKPNIDQLPQLEITKSQDDESADSEEDAADAENPYDYRHFIAEAKADAETGAATPKSHPTGTADPKPGAPRTLATNKTCTPHQSPFVGASIRKKTEAKSTSHVPPKSTKPVAPNVPKTKARTNAASARGKTGQKPAEQINLEREEQDKAPSAHSKPRRPREASSSQTYTPSPHIIVDEASDLTIDMGSPPLKAKPKHKINPDAFASHSRAQSRANSTSNSPQSNVAHGDGERDAEGDLEMDEADGNDDIEDLALPSPRETRTTSNAMGRIMQDRVVEDDDEDDGLAAELEAVFDQEDDRDARAVGLGISGSQHHGQMQNEEESEVSEEE